MWSWWFSRLHQPDACYLVECHGSIISQYEYTHRGNWYGRYIHFLGLMRKRVLNTEVLRKLFLDIPHERLGSTPRVVSSLVVAD